MPINGQVYLIINPVAFFEPIVLSGGAPSTGFAIVEGYSFTATMTLFFTLGGVTPFSFSFVSASVTSASDGSFTLPDPPNLPAQFGVLDIQMAITLSQTGVQFYRSQLFPYQNAGKGLKIYLYTPTLPQSDGFSAGQVSSALANQSLPGNTTLTASSSGLGVAGSESQANIEFGVLVVPDTSPNLNLFFDLSLNSWDISVGWPDDWCESPDDILNSIRSGLQTADSDANGFVQSHLSTILQGSPFDLTPGEATTLLNNVSVQFTAVSFPNQHSWALSNQNDGTIVIFPQLVIGFPRGW